MNLFRLYLALTLRHCHGNDISSNIVTCVIINKREFQKIEVQTLILTQSAVVSNGQTVVVSGGQL